MCAPRMTNVRLAYRNGLVEITEVPIRRQTHMSNTLVNPNRGIPDLAVVVADHIRRRQLNTPVNIAEGFPELPELTVERY